MNQNVANQDLRQKAKDRGIFLWQIAKRLGISVATMTIWMREELAENDPRRERIEAVLDEFEREW